MLGQILSLAPPDKAFILKKNNSTVVGRFGIPLLSLLQGETVHASGKGAVLVALNWLKVVRVSLCSRLVALNSLKSPQNDF